MAIQSRVFPGPLSKLISIGSPKLNSDFETLMTGFSGTSLAILNELLAKTVKLSSSKK